MTSRSRGRQFAVQMIYQHHFSGYELERDLELFWRGAKTDNGTRRFTEFLVRGVTDHQTELDMEVSAYLKNWTIDRIVLIDRIILQIAFFELLHTEDVPWKVVVDEAVVLTQSFNSDSTTFVNGVLHAWATKNRAQTPTSASQAETRDEEAKPEPN